jgi:rod shape-determining protein MreC
MSHRATRKRARYRNIAVVASISIVILIVTSRFTGGVSGLLQVLVPVQHAMSSVVAMDGGQTVQLSSEESDRIGRRLAAYQQQLASMHVRLEDLAQRNAELRGIRQLGYDQGRLIRARVVAGDSLPWRQSRLLDQGTLAGVAGGNAVVSGFFVDTGEEDNVLDGMTVLAGETLIGEVIDASTHTARVLLLTDPASRPRAVRLARRTPGGFQIIPSQFVLRGAGGNRMVIDGVEHALIDQKTVQVGDVVLTATSDDRLPVPVVIGTVMRVRREDDNAVLHNLVIDPAVDPQELEHVYIVDTSRR